MGAGVVVARGKVMGVGGGNVIVGIAVGVAVGDCVITGAAVGTPNMTDGEPIISLIGSRMLVLGGGVG
jgi:hypothetical protein